MTEQQYKKHTVLYIISEILFIVSAFAAIFTAALMQEFRVTFSFVIFALFALISLVYFVGFIVWSLKNETGRQYWVIFFKKKSLQFVGRNHLFVTKPGQHPADRMKMIILQGLSLTLALVLLSTFMFR